MLYYFVSFVIIYLLVFFVITEIFYSFARNMRYFIGVIGAALKYLYYFFTNLIFTNMKRILLFLMVFLFGTIAHADVCTQTFSGSGQDDDPTIVTVVPSDLSCTVGGAITGIIFKNAAGSMTNSNCGSWYQFHLLVDGIEVAVGCATDLNGTSISSGFSTIELRSEDLDAYSDGVTLTFDLEVTYTPPSCPAPSALTVTNITTTSADLGWTTGGAAAWEIVVQPDGTGAPTGAGTATTTNPYSATGLTANTAYEFYVRDNCGSEFSIWAGPYPFFTGYCQVVSTSSSSYTDDFTTTNGAANISNTSSGYALNGYEDATAMVVSQYEGASVDFSAAFVGTTVGFNIWVDWNSDLDFDDTGEQVYASGSYVSSASGTITVPASTPLGDYRMRIRCDYNSTNPNACGASGSGRNETEDYTFTVISQPSCLPPTVLTATNITATSADLGWTTGGAAAWEIVVQPDGTGAPTGAGTATTANPYSATGLTANTAYEFYVRDNCGSEFSTWSGPFAFTTPCDALAIPYSNDFEMNADCWSFVDANSDNKTWSLPTTTNCGSKSLKAGYSAAGTPMDDWAISPSLLMTAGTDYKVSFTSGNNSTSYIEKMEVFVMDGTDPSTAQKVMIYNDDNINDNACYPSDIQVTAPAGWAAYYVGFHCYSDGNQYYLYLDNFNVDVAPAQSTWTVDDNNANSCDLTTVNGAAGSVWHDVYNGADIVASINTNGQNLGSVFVEMRDAATTVEEYSVQGTTDMKKTLPKFYNFDSDNTFTNPVTVRLYFTDGELSDFNASALGTGVTTLAASDIDVTHYDGLSENCDFSDNDQAGAYTLIDNANITVGTVSGGFYLEFNVSSFSEFLAHEPAAAPLPIALSNFQGKLMTRSNMLTWTTETERNGSYFDVQRAVSGSLDFETIGRVDANGNTNTLMSYSFEDEKPSSLAYYRLKMVDLDGSFEYSDVISLLRKEKGFGLYGAYPVPTSAVLTVEFTTEEASDMTVALTDVTGRVLLTEKFESTSGIQKHDVDMSSLALGTYFVKLSDGQQTLIQRVVKQ